MRRFIKVVAFVSPQFSKPENFLSDNCYPKLLRGTFPWLSNNRYAKTQLNYEQIKGKTPLAYITTNSVQAGIELEAFWLLQTMPRNRQPQVYNGCFCSVVSFGRISWPPYCLNTKRTSINNTMPWGNHTWPNLAAVIRHLATRYILCLHTTCNFPVYQGDTAWGTPATPHTATSDTQRHPTHSFI